MKRICVYFVYVMTFCLINTPVLNNHFEMNHQAYAQPDFTNLSRALYDLKTSEKALCISFLKNSDMSSKEIADAVLEWDPDKHKGVIAAVIRTKITRLTEGLKNTSREQLISDVDLIKNTRLTTSEILRLLKEINRVDRG